MYLHYSAISDVGRVRRENQDSGYAGPWLLTVCYGVGGAVRGDLASSTAVQALRKLDQEPDDDLLGQAKVVGPGGEVLAATRSKGGIARVEVDLDTTLRRSRRVLNHLAERRPETYTPPPQGDPPCA